MAKQIKIQIFPDGRIQAETNGIKGRACTNYIRILEELLNARTYDSEYKPEYDEKNQLQVSSGLNLNQDNELTENNKLFGHS